VLLRGGAESEAIVAGEIKPYVIVVGIDYSEASELALLQAFQIAARMPKGEVHPVHVAPLRLPPLAMTAGADGATASPSPSVEDNAAELQRYVQERYNARQAEGVIHGAPARIVTHLRWETTAQQIAQLASDLEADLVIVATHGRRGIARVLLGSVAEGVVRLAPCPVLVTRPKQILEVPRIEPPCPECLRARRDSNGEQLWCDQHSERHGQRHVYQRSDRVAADGGMPLVYPLDHH
jgi:nucleotide-binding universal stress UspA family protein